MIERRQARRRTIPFLRGGVLQVGEREHIVSIVDLSPEGAFLATRVEVAAEAPVSLKAVFPRAGHQVSLPCEVVWSNAAFDPKTGRPAGMAVRFLHDDEAVRERLALFAEEGPFPTPTPGAVERYEYRLIELAEMHADDLNRLGRDGWALSAVLPRVGAVQLVLRRRV